MDTREQRRFIQSHLSGQTITSLQKNTDGWDNDLYIVNEQTVFRFPKTLEVASKVILEAELLHALHNTNPMLEIPKYSSLYNENQELIGVSYRKIPGQPLASVKSSHVCTSANAKLIADFLTKLHRLPRHQPSLVKRLSDSLTTTHWAKLLSSIEEKLFPYFSDLYRAEITDTFSQFIQSPSVHSKTTVHGDLTASNLLIDQEKQIMTGVIDFTDAMWADPAFDFGGFYWTYGGCFTKDILAHYDTDENKDHIYKRVREFYGLQPVFHDMLYTMRHQLEFNWATALSTFLKRKHDHS
ncbi:phosphotransferase family protein [Halobacillus hunanensis]|uniref:phosphotransferase family protein n=1 Tax=Halobacillus hunanensis TaxID=578214 RepID=UPI0009A8F74B|nr:aminoglycoside phosphotransferase family protein [Halobacillus hunanensis]